MSRSVDPFNRILGRFNDTQARIISLGASAEEVETIEMLCAAIRRFGERHIDSQRIDAESKIPGEVLRAAAEMGLFGLTIDQAYGGAGLSMKGTCKVIECMGSVDSSVGVTIGLHGGLGLRGLSYFGSEELKSRYLPDLATGKLIACFPVTESEAGSDIASVRTTAVEDGDHLVVNGSKIYATNGGIAHLATTVARTPGLGSSRRGHSMILIPLDLPGVHRDAEEHKLGIRGSSTCSLHFEDVRVGKDHIVGTPSSGLDHLNHILAWGRTFMSAGCIGLSRLALQRTLDQVTTRRQFNRPIAEFGMVREMVADMRSRIHAMESLIRMATQLEDDRADTIGWESSVVKVFCSEAAWRICDDTVQLHGGSGFIEDTGVARILRDCRITRIFEGANELMRFHLASATFTWKAEALQDAPRLASLCHVSLRDESSLFDELLGRLAASLQQKKKTHGLKVFRRQMDQRRVANAASGLYIVLSLVARAHGELQAGTLSDDMLRWTRYGIGKLASRVKRELEELDDNQDDICSEIAAAECERIGLTLKESSV